MTTNNRTLTAAVLTSLMTAVALSTSPATAAPIPDPDPISDVAPPQTGFGHRPCFLERTPWNVALDGPPPRCG